MKVQVPLITNIARYSKVYWQYSSYRLCVLLGITFLVGCTESLGIALFMPILQKTNLTADSTDKLSLFFNKLFAAIGMPPTLQAVLVLMLLIFLFKGFLKFAEGAYQAHLTSSMNRTMRNHMIRQFGEMSFRYYIDSNTGTLSSLITVETNRAIASFSRYCQVVIRLITIMVFLACSLWINALFTLAILVCSTVTLYLLRSISTMTKQYSRQTSREYAALHNLLIQTLQAFKYMKATHSFRILQEKLFHTTSTIARLQYTTNLFGSILAALSEPLIVFFIVAMVFYQVIIIKGSLAPIIVSIMFFYRIFQLVMGFQRNYQDFASYIGGIETITRTSQEVQSHRETCGSTTLPGTNGVISFQNVHFSYNTDKAVLQDVSFTIKKNTTVAFVGESGVGKTTIVDLLTGILVPQQGRILIDDVPLGDIDYRDWRKRLGYVVQEPVLFNDTVANNISLWSCDHDNPSGMENIQKAARQAYCHQFIQRLPQQYATIIGDRGIKLSGGQRQRLAIARELFKNPELLILDEATSSLDTESELNIRQGIRELKGKITVVLIAHRLSTIRDADYVYVMDAGRIVESGAFNDLLHRPGSQFRKMCELQHMDDLAERSD